MFDDVLLAQSAVDRFKNAAYDFVMEGESYRPRLKPKLDAADVPPPPPAPKPKVHPSDGTFAPRLDFTANSAQDLAFGDVNRDGKPDLAVAAWSGPASILLNTSR
jgi:hypothetical protein